MERMVNNYGSPGGRFDPVARPGGGGSYQGRPYLRPVEPGTPVMRPVTEPANVNRPMWIPIPPFGGGFAEVYGVPDDGSFIWAATVGSHQGYSIISGPCAQWPGPSWDTFSPPVMTFAPSALGACGIVSLSPEQYQQALRDRMQFSTTFIDAGVRAHPAVQLPGYMQIKSYRAWLADVGTSVMPVSSTQPVPVVWPLPWSLPAGFAQLPGQSMVPDAALHPVPRISPRLDPDGRVRARPYVRPAIETVFPGSSPWVNGRPAPRPRPRRVPHLDVPDGAKKVRSVPAALMAALKVFHAATELDDFVDALYASLSQWRKRRCGRPSGLGGKFACVVNNFDAFTTDPGAADNIQRAINNLLENNVNDRALGKLFGAKWKGLGPDRGTGVGATNPPPSYMSPMV